jgi:hypothetical protein
MNFNRSLFLIEAGLADLIVKTFVIIGTILFFLFPAFAQDRHFINPVSNRPGDPGYCAARLEGDSLIFETSRIKRCFIWNNGNIKTFSVENKESKSVWVCNAKDPDISFPGVKGQGENGILSVKNIPEGSAIPAHLEATVNCSIGSIEVKRVFRLYPDCPAIACDLFLRGKANTPWVQSEINSEEQQMSSAASGKVPVVEKLELPGHHWKIDAVEFHDVTDRFNNVTKEVSGISYFQTLFRGNLLFATEISSGNGIFLLKEAPCSNSQLAYSDNDFLTEFGTIKILGAGISNSDLDAEQWRRAYGFVTGVYEGETNRLLALHNYLQRIRIHQPGRDEMIMMNFWGDHAEHTQIDENFTMIELESGAKLGITHLQLDWGWQKGDGWNPDPVKFPNGLTPVVRKGKELGINISLWFNPSPENNNANWEKDADALIQLYKAYGIRTFKIDGVKLPTKESEINFRKMLDKVVQITNGEVVFNLDITAGKRGGYFYFNEYGNMFMENRYTDYPNYFPWWTLRNLWMLSKYIPAQNLQVEFLNKWRNQGRYGNDPFAPGKYSFDYLFAITMAGQPLAWFEGGRLPDEAFLSAPTIKQYRKVQADFHNGYILPIGEEPSGTSWTGFQSQKSGANNGYVLVFREQNPNSTKAIKLPMLFPGKYEFEKILGDGHSFTTKVIGGWVNFNMPGINKYSFYKYSLVKKD